MCEQATPSRPTLRSNPSSCVRIASSRPARYASLYYYGRCSYHYQEALNCTHTHTRNGAYFSRTGPLPSCQLSTPFSTTFNLNVRGSAFGHSKTPVYGSLQRLCQQPHEQNAICRCAHSHFYQQHFTSTRTRPLYLNWEATCAFTRSVSLLPIQIV